MVHIGTIKMVQLEPDALRYFELNVLSHWYRKNKEIHLRKVQNKLVYPNKRRFLWVFVYPDKAYQTTIMLNQSNNIHLTAVHPLHHPPPPKKKSLKAHSSSAVQVGTEDRKMLETRRQFL